MILQALVQHYEDLVVKDEKGEIERPGWNRVKVSYAVELNGDGDILRVFSVMSEDTRGKKTVIVPQIMVLPAFDGAKGSGVRADFMWGNTSYIIGTDNKGKPMRSRECFLACRELHLMLLSNVESPVASAIVNFFSKWEPENTAEHPVLKELPEEILNGVNLVFYYNGSFAHKDPKIQAAWQSYYSNSDGAPQQICLVTGNLCTTARLHPPIKGVQGAQSSGAMLVSFKEPADCSFGKEQGQNAPTGEYAAFAYGAALNHLIADRAHRANIGDTTVLFWAKGGEPEYQNAFGGFAFGAESYYSEEELSAMLGELCKGRAVEFNGVQLNPECEFYVLGIAPNAARLSVRFFWKNSFGTLLKNVKAHRERLEIVRPEFDNYPTLPLWKLLGETVNQNSRDKTPSPAMAGEVLRAILNDTIYPATFLNGVILRIRAEHEVTRGRAAIIKAFYLKNRNPDVPEEVLTVALNQETTNVPYVLGRLFSVLEDIQQKANPGINATIKDKYFNSASSTPATVFPILMNLAQKHLRKMEAGYRTFFEKRLGEITAILPEEFPVRLSLPQQGSFQLGYYHQTQARYQK